MLKLVLLFILAVGIYVYYLFRKRSASEFHSGPGISTSATLEKSPPADLPRDLGKDFRDHRHQQDQEVENFVVYDLTRYEWIPGFSSEKVEKEVTAFLKNIPPPEILSSKLHRLLASPDANFKEIARIISLDPLLTAEVLRIANSAYYRTTASQKITSVHRAIVLLGYNQLRMILLHYFFRKTLDKYSPLSAREIRDIWKHSVEVSGILGYIALRKGYDPGLYITAGILHDVGKFFLPLFGEEGFCSSSACTEDLPPLKEEEIRYGFGHHLLGGLLVKFWDLPSEIYAATAYHHPVSREQFWDLPPEERKLAAWVAVADYLSHLYGSLESRYAYRIPGWIYRILEIRGPAEKLATGELLSSLRKASLVAEGL